MALCWPLILAGLNAPAYAQAPAPETMVVTGTRLTQEPFNQPYAFYRATIEDLDERVGRKALDRMNYGPGVFLQRTAPNQASPFVRGLTGEQTLLMLDGIRLNHAFMRPGPNQYAALVPDLSLSAIDVILGSSSTVNGSDGLTGALDFRLARAGRGTEEGQSVWANTRLDTGNGTSLETGIDGTHSTTSYSIEFGSSNYRDRKGGDRFRSHLFGSALDGDRIPNTAYEAYTGGLRIDHRGIRDHRLQLNAGHKRQEDAPRPDGYFENSGRPDRISRYFDPQQFTYVHLKDSWRIDNNLIRRLDTSLWSHQFDETQLRSTIRNQGTSDALLRRREYHDKLDARGIDMQATTLLGATSQHELVWGATYIHERTDNSFREFRTPAGSRNPAELAPHRREDWSFRTTVPDNSTYETIGVFLQDNWRINERFSLLLGLRFSDFAWSFNDVDGNTHAATPSARLLWQVNPGNRIFAGASRGFRAPNLTNLSGLYDRGSSGNLATGDRDLEPEVSLTYELGWKWRGAGNSFGLSIFRTDIDDFIQRDFSVTPAITRNVARASLHGFESLWDFGIEIGEGQRVAFFGSVSLSDATRDIPIAGGGTFQDPISRANRLYGHVGIKYERNSRWSGLLQLRAQDTYDDVATHPSDADADDVRLTAAGGPDGSMPGYGVVDLVVGWASTGGNVKAKLFVENLADRTCREPGSGVDAVGRNVGLTARLRF